MSMLNPDLGVLQIVVMSSTSSAVTYTSIYTDSKPGRIFWGADEEISDGGPEDPHTPPVLQDEDEREAMFIQPHDPDYVCIESDPEEDPKEYEDDETEDGPVDYPIDGGEDGDDDDGDSSRDDADDEDKDEWDEDDEDEDEEEEEEEHLALADSAVVVPTVELVSPPKGTEPVIPPPSTDSTTTGARITVLASIFHIPSTRGREGGYCIRDTWWIRQRQVPEGSIYDLVEVNTRVTELAELHERDTQDLYALLEDAQYDRTRISQRVAMDSQRVNLLMGDRMTLQETIWIMEEEAYASREAWAHSIGLS
ncbi:hypothetical protein Tco_0697030 [Tanacetum coccineum]